MPAQIRAVDYYRMSEDRQEASIPDQKEWAKGACQRENVRIVRTFEDHGIPGSETDQRPDFMALLAFCEQQAKKGTPIEAVVCWDGDRFSRADSIRTAAQVCRLIDAGVTRMLSSEGWTDWTDDVDRVLYNLKQDLGRAAYSKSLSKTVSRAMLQRAREGKWIGSSTPFGYLLGPDGRLALGDSAHVEAVRWMFQAYAYTLASLADIAREINKRGLRTGRGKPWTRYSVRGVLLNPRYMGDAVWNVTHKGKYHRLKGGTVQRDEQAPAREARRRRGPARNGRARFGAPLKHLQPIRNAAEDIVIVRDAHPALVDRETFVRVGEKVHASFRHNTTPLEGGGDWALAGMLSCAHCGSVLWGVRETVRRKGKVYVYRKYLCSGGRRHGAAFCRKNAVDDDVILTEIVALLQEKLAAPGALDALRERIALMKAEAAHDYTARREQLKRTLDALAKQIEQGNVNLALLPADRLPAVVAKVREWEAQQEQAQHELEALDSAAETGENLGEQAEQAVLAVQQLAKTMLLAEPAEVRAALAGMVKSVTVHFADRPPEEVACKLRRGPIMLDFIELELQPDFANLLCPADPRCA
jgi:DNA invertase Pin-like site-specific DNA recombinase